MTYGDFAVELKKLAEQAKSLASKLEGIDPNAVVLEPDTILKGPIIEPDPRVFVYCGAPGLGGGLEVVHFMKALNGVANWLEDLKAPIEELDSSAPIGGPGEPAS